jgi:hypothetical protein
MFAKAESKGGRLERMIMRKHGVIYQDERITTKAAREAAQASECSDLPQ